MKALLGLIIAFTVTQIDAQDLGQGLVANDLNAHPMQAVAKPAYLDTYIDPSFGTTIRRISNAPLGEGIVPMYSTVQAWNADESLMILYDLSTGSHQLLDGQDYSFIRYLDDVNPDDLENLFWDFEDPDVLYYLDPSSGAFMQYSMSSETASIRVDLDALLPGCQGDYSMGNDVQMMSWDSDVFSFRCGNEAAYYYRLSTQTLGTFNLTSIDDVAPMPAPSGTRFFHDLDTYDANGTLELSLNADSPEHACIGQLSNGNDAYISIAFEEGPGGGCQGDMVAHDLITGDCFPISGPDLGYTYPQSGTHISALAHKNTQPGWLCASFMGFDLDGQDLLDQELVIALADPNGPLVYRIGHHRSDENDFDYWGEPHAVISPTGTRVLFASDWSGSEDGQSIDSYVVELPIHGLVDDVAQYDVRPEIKLTPNPAGDYFSVESNSDHPVIGVQILDAMGRIIRNVDTRNLRIDISDLEAGTYHVCIHLSNAIEILPLAIY